MKEPKSSDPTRRPITINQAYRMALNLHRSGRLPESERIYKSIIGTSPGHVGALNNLGLIQLGRGETSEAADLFRRAVDRDPQSAESHNNFGNALLALGNRLEAARQFEKAIEIRRDYVEAQNGLGNASAALGRLEDAEGRYRAAIRINPDYFSAQYNLGVLLMQLERHEEALEHLSVAVALRPDDFKACNNLSAVLIALGHSEEAVDRLQTGIGRRPDAAELYHTMGHALETLGRLPEARQAFEDAIARSPGATKFYRSSAECMRFSEGDRRLAAMEALNERLAGLSHDEQVDLHCALAKAYADLNRFQDAFQHLVAGNRIVRHNIAYNESEALELFNRIKIIFNAEIICRNREVGHPSPAPIFIIGAPRSGSTLIEQIVASHREVYGGGELKNFPKLVANFYGRSNASNRFPESLLSMTDEQFYEIGSIYLKSIEKNMAGARRITDKLPSNFLFVGLIHLVLPNARIIHVHRDPVDTCFSWFSKIFKGGQPFSYDLAELGRYYRAYYDLMAHWRGLLPKGVMLDVRYESVVADIEPQARRIIAHCGLEWDESCLAFHRAKRVVATPSRNDVRQPLYTTSIGRSRPYRVFLEPLLSALGDDLAAAPQER